MVMRLLAHYFDRNEALIVNGALTAAGVPNFLNSPALGILPFHDIALGGHRIMVPEEEVENAIALLEEAWRMRSFEGERLSQQSHFAKSFLVYYLTGLPLPFRTSQWHDVDADPPPGKGRATRPQARICKTKASRRGGFRLWTEGRAAAEPALFLSAVAAR